MALLLTQKDLQPLMGTFLEDTLHVMQEALVSSQSHMLGDISWLAFPLSQEKRVNILALMSPQVGTMARVFPLSGNDAHTDANIVLLLDQQDGHLLALLAGDDLDPFRTSAPVALACRYLAPPAAKTLAILGSGVQAHYHLRVIRPVLPSLEKVRVFSRTPENRQRYAQEMSVSQNIAVEAVDSVQQAVENADIICVTIPPTPPLLEQSWVSPGALITSILPRWAAKLDVREIVPDRKGPEARPSRWDPHPMGVNGGRDASTFSATLSEVIRGTVPARVHQNEIVYYEQLGTFAWDAALIHWAYQWAFEQHVGVQFHLSSV